MDSLGPEDSIGIRIPIIPQWDPMAAQEFTACQADWTQRSKIGNPMVEKVLAYISGMGIETGAQPDGSQRTWPPALDDRASTAPSSIVAAALSPNQGDQSDCGTAPSQIVAAAPSLIEATLPPIDEQGAVEQVEQPPIDEQEEVEQVE